MEILGNQPTTKKRVQKKKMKINKRELQFISENDNNDDGNRGEEKKKKKKKRMIIDNDNRTKRAK